MVKMGNDWNGQMGFQDSSELMLGCPSLELNSGVAEKLVAGLDMNNSSGSMFDSSNGGRMGSCYGSGWSESFGASEMVSHGNFGSPLCPGVSENTGLRGTSQFMQHHYSSDANAVEMLPKLSVSGGSGSFAGMVNPYGLPGCATDKNIVIEKASVDPVQSEEDCRMSKETSLEAKSIGKRKRNAERDVQRDSSVKTSEQKKTDEKKQKIEENDSSDQGNKKTTDTSLGGEVSKGDYVHVRARSGQATNSHSLAERVRREKINDRMKLLQELVPGCNKITGKAVMLDEIINYVQSLQQQVEFLSMKLATVNPELNVNNDQSLSKDIFHFRDSSAGAPILGLNPGMSSSHLGATGIHHGAFPGIPSTAAPYHAAPQGMWDGDLQSLLRMGFDSNPPISDLGPNGSSKT